MSIVDRSTTNLPLFVVIVDGSTGLGITGLTVTARLRDANSSPANLFYDFSDDTFKTSGWATLNVTLAETDSINSPGLYALAGGVDLSAATNLPSSTFQLQPLFNYSGSVTGAGDGELINLSGSALPTAENIDTTLTSAHGSGNWEGAVGGAGAQAIRDAMKLAPSAGTPAIGSVDQHLDDIESDVSDILSDTSTMQPLVSTNLDEQVSTRSAPGDAMDLVTDAVDSDSLAASGLSEISTQIGTDLDAAHGVDSWEGAIGASGAQAIRDAMKLAPSAGAADPLSVDDVLLTTRGLLDNALSRNVRSRVFTTAGDITGDRFVPSGAVSHIEVDEREEGGSWPGEIHYVVLAYAAGATATDRAAVTTIQTTVPVDGSFDSPVYPPTV